MKLEANCEIVGVLSGMKNTGGRIDLEFTIHRVVEIPLGVISEKDLTNLVGMRVGIFNCGNGSYKIRRIKNK